MIEKKHRALASIYLINDAVASNLAMLCAFFLRFNLQIIPVTKGQQDISTYVAGYPYIAPAGFGYPFGDYFELAIDDRGATQAVWGEGLNYDTPGSIWYAHGR